jgi:hypothetical protein
MKRRLVPCFLLGALALFAQEDQYTGPRPPKPDVVYLKHASNLLATETVEARQQNKGDSTTYSVEGASSSARTPLAEPIFILESEKLRPEALELYKFDVKNGRRELTLSEKKKKDNPRAYRLSVTRVGRNLYRVEASETLENGEYGLSPQGANSVFCFQVF